MYGNASLVDIYNQKKRLDGGNDQWSHSPTMPEMTTGPVGNPYTKDGGPGGPAPDEPWLVDQSQGRGYQPPGIGGMTTNSFDPASGQNPTSGYPGAQLQNIVQQMPGGAYQGPAGGINTGNRGGLANPSDFLGDPSKWGPKADPNAGAWSNPNGGPAVWGAGPSQRMSHNVQPFASNGQPGNTLDNITKRSMTTNMNGYTGGGGSTMPEATTNGATLMSGMHAPNINRSSPNMQMMNQPSGGNSNGQATTNGAMFGGGNNTPSGGNSNGQATTNGAVFGGGGGNPNPQPQPGVNPPGTSYANADWFQRAKSGWAFREPGMGDAIRDGTGHFIHEIRGPGSYNGMDNYTPGEVREYWRVKEIPGHGGNAEGKPSKYNGQQYERIDPNTGQVIGTGTLSGLGDGMGWKAGLAMIAASALAANFFAGNLPGMTPNPMPGGTVPPGMEGILPPTSNLPPGYGSVPGGSGVPGAPGNNPSAYLPPGTDPSVLNPPLDFGPPNYSDVGPMPPPGNFDYTGPPNYSDVGPMPETGPAPNNPGGTPIGPPGGNTPNLPGGGNNQGGNGNGMNLGQLLGLLGAAYGGNQRQKAADDMLAWLDGQQKKIDTLYAPGSAEYDYLWKQMSAKDAAAGRNSQYGPRSTELGAKITDIKAGHTADMTKSMGHLMASSLNQNADAYAGIPALLASMGGGGGFLDNISLDDLTGWLDDLFGG